MIFLVVRVVLAISTYAGASAILALLKALAIAFLAPRLPTFASFCYLSFLLSREGQRISIKASLDSLNSFAIIFKGVHATLAIAPFTDLPGPEAVAVEK